MQAGSITSSHVSLPLRVTSDSLYTCFQLALPPGPLAPHASPSALLHMCRPHSASGPWHCLFPQLGTLSLLFPQLFAIIRVSVPVSLPAHTSVTSCRRWPTFPSLSPFSSSLAILFLSLHVSLSEIISVVLPLSPVCVPHQDASL